MTNLSDPEKKSDTNYIDKWSDFFFSHKIFAIFILIYFMIVGLGNFLDGLGEIHQGYNNVLDYFETYLLIRNSDVLAQEINMFLDERKNGDPALSFENINEDQWLQETQNYDNETIAEYQQYFQPEITDYLNKLTSRDLQSESFNDLRGNYDQPVNVLEIGRIASDMLNIASELRNSTDTPIN